MPSSTKNKNKEGKQCKWCKRSGLLLHSLSSSPEWRLRWETERNKHCSLEGWQWSQVPGISQSICVVQHQEWFYSCSLHTSQAFFWSWWGNSAHALMDTGETGCQLLVTLHQSPAWCLFNASRGFICMPSKDNEHTHRCLMCCFRS